MPRPGERTFAGLRREVRGRPSVFTVRHADCGQAVGLCAARQRPSPEAHRVRIDTGEPEEILWNFEKFLIDRQGTVIDRFAPDVPPDAEIVVSAIERVLDR
jgi:glutathione peroxidase-family protein